MRSVVVVLPASTWAMMPILRISESGVVRAIAKIPCLKGGLRGRVKSRAFCHDVGASVEKKTCYCGALSRLKARKEPQGGAPIRVCLFDAVAAPFKAGSLGPKVVGSIAGRRSAAGLSRVKAGLANRPAITLEFVLALLFLGLTILWVGNEVRRARRSWSATLSLQSGRRRDGLILAHAGIPAVVSVIGVIVRNAAPPIGGVVIGKRCEIEAERYAAPTPAPRPPKAAAPAVAIAAMPSAITAMPPTEVAAAAIVLRECRCTRGQRSARAQCQGE